MWYIGQKVVCVNDRVSSRTLQTARYVPRRGQVYTICFIVRGTCVDTGAPDVLGFILTELPNPNFFGFRATRFVPLCERLDQECRARMEALTTALSMASPVLTTSDSHMERARPTRLHEKEKALLEQGTPE
jgi:hypothetical protein